MSRKLKWGCLSTSNFARTVFLPAFAGCEHAELTAIASRNIQSATAAANSLGIPKPYGSYEELLADPEIDVVYNPMPNHLHLPWSAKAAEAGKHVLCEKPITLNVAEAREMIAVRDRTGVAIGEAFMVRTHPQWLRAREIVQSGALGELRSLNGFFSYYNDDPRNIRNQPAIGGGALYDIGCYPITTMRLIVGEEPRRVCGIIQRDPRMEIDRLTSAILDFPSGQATWTVSTQSVPYQRVQVYGTTGRLDIEIPFNAPNDKPCRILLDDGSDKTGASAKPEEFAVCDQYTIEIDEFSKAAAAGRPLPVPLEDSIANMAVIEAVFKSAESGNWEVPAI
jgi:predicted dehydrogenase